MAAAAAADTARGAVWRWTQRRGRPPQFALAAGAREHDTVVAAGACEHDVVVAVGVAAAVRRARRRETARWRGLWAGAALALGLLLGALLAAPAAPPPAPPPPALQTEYGAADVARIQWHAGGAAGPPAALHDALDALLRASPDVSLACHHHLAFAGPPAPAPVWLWPYCLLRRAGGGGVPLALLAPERLAPGGDERLVAEARRVPRPARATVARASAVTLESHGGALHYRLAGQEAYLAQLALAELQLLRYPPAAARAPQF